MKNTLTYIFLLISFFVNAQKYISISDLEDFKPNEIKYTFGDNVRLRSQPNVHSETLLKIPIGQPLTILEKNENTYSYNGVEWNWYKVKYQDKIGYVVGGLLSLDTKKANRDIYLTSFKQEKYDEHSFKGSLLVRLYANGKIIKKEFPFDDMFEGISFKMKVFNNVGISNVKNVLFISVEEVTCGFSITGYYYFNDEKKLNKAIELYSGGNETLEVSEKLIFPNDKNGKKGFIGVEQTTYEMQKNEEIKSSSKIACWLKWQGKEMKCK